MEDGDDRRRSERVAINDEFQKLGGDGIAFVSNLSVTGVFVHTGQLLPIGTKIELRFTVLLDDPVLIEASGEVVRHHTGEDPGMGVRFGPMSPEMVLRIQDAIARRRPRDSGAPVAAGSREPSGTVEFESQVTGVFRPVNDPNATRSFPTVSADADDGAAQAPTGDDD